MENCLVTKLKGAVDNENLPVLGKNFIHLLNGTKFGIEGNTGSVGYYAKIETPNVQFISNDGQLIGNTLTSPVNVASPVSVNGDCLVSIPRYGVTVLGAPASYPGNTANIYVDGSYSEYKYADNLLFLKAHFTEGGDIKDVLKSTLVNFCDYNYYIANGQPVRNVNRIVSGRFEDFSVCTGLQEFYLGTGTSLVPDSLRTHISGNIVDGIGSLTNLKEFLVFSDYMEPSTIELLTKRQVEAGRRSGILFIDVGSKLTFNGVFTGGKNIEFGQNSVNVKSGETILGTYNISTDTWTYA